MTLFWDNQHPSKTCDKALVEGVLEACLALHGAYESAEVGVTLVDDEEIWALNREHRDIDRATDVLSFPMLDYEEAYEQDGREAEEATDDGQPPAENPMDGETPESAWEEPDPDVDPQTGEILLGDIVISLDTAERQAGAYGHSFEREVGFLACHGMLHLLGYDHMTPQDEALMLDLQRQVMEAVGLERDEHGLATPD